MVKLVVKQGAFRDAIFPPKVRWSIVIASLLLSFIFFYKSKNSSKALIWIIIAIILLLLAIVLTYDEVSYRIRNKN